MSKLETTTTKELVNDAVMADIELDELDSLLAEPSSSDSIEVSDDDLEATVTDLDNEAAVTEAYEAQDSEADAVEVTSEDDAPVTTELSEKGKGKAKTRSTMAGAKKSVVLRERLGEKMSEALVLELSDAKLKPEELVKQQDALLDAIDQLAVKVGEKAVNLIGAVNGSAKLSTYTAIAIKFLTNSEEGITAIDLITHMKDQTANGVKGYSEGTARSQGHQMYKLLPAMKIAVLDDKTMNVNPESTLLDSLSAMID